MPLTTNDASGQNTGRPGDATGSENSPIEVNDTSPSVHPALANAAVPKPKRLACMICRKRKLRCDGMKPSCSTCTRLGHSCAYDEVRRKSGPKRGYVKALEERLKQVESLLKTTGPGEVNTEPVPPEPTSNTFTTTTNNNNNNSSSQNTPHNQQAAATAKFNVNNPSIAIAGDGDMDRWCFTGESPQAPRMDDFDYNISMQMNTMDSSTFTWEMIGLGLQEPLPPQDTIDELHQIYFEKVHPSIPMIHKYRYLAAMNLAPNQRPPVALRYAIWTLACSVTDKFSEMKDLFYQRARKYVEEDYIKGYGEHMLSVAHAQTHVLLAQYEFKMMFFPRAWMNTGQAVRLCQMIGLHRLDGAGLDVKQCLPPPRDWTEKEERRRTFWMAFCEDRYASIGTGWPMSIDERDIMTYLPASEDAFDMSRPETTQSLGDSMCPSGAGKLSAFGGIVLMACLFGRNLIHLHRPDSDDRDNDLNGEFWKRHRHIDNILLNTSLCLPNHLKLPTGLPNPNIIFTNMNIHTSTICLHQAAIFKADKNRLPATVSAESKVRCITAANEIASIMKMVSHLDLATMNPFLSFCLYVASRVFVQYLKSRPDDSQTINSLRFLLSAMNALKRKNPLTESFLVQLDVDLEALGMRIPKLKAAFPRSGDSPANPGLIAHMKAKSRTKDVPHSKEGHGIAKFSEECNYMKATGDSGNPVDRPDIVTPSSALQPPGFDSSSWLTSEHTLPTRERSTGPDTLTPEFNFAIDSHNLRVSPNAGYMDSQSSGTNNIDSQSNQPTPNSSTASEQRNSTSGPMTTPGRTSFDASPMGSHQPLGTQAEMDAATAAFFTEGMGDTNFGMSGTGTGMTPGNDFSMPNSWGMSGQTGAGTGVGTGMTPVAEGVLRTLLDMPPMDAMDLGWNSGT